MEQHWQNWASKKLVILLGNAGMSFPLPLCALRFARQHSVTLKHIRFTEKNMEMGQLNEELNTALSERLELEAKMASSTDERKSLLERCLEAEAEVERARSNLIELRRKLDDSQAALQELGRENQAIQVRSPLTSQTFPLSLLVSHRDSARKLDLGSRWSEALLQTCIYRLVTRRFFPINFYDLGPTSSES